MITVFILTYKGIDYFDRWFHPSNYVNTQFYIIDNGSQSFPERLQSRLLYATAQNIGCAGGLNLLSHIAFDHMGLDKIIVGQDDGKFTQQMLDEMWANITPDTFVGGYNRSFEFALFGFHRDLYRAVGDLDENFIFGGCEDNDYKHRMKLLNKRLWPMNYDANLNCSLSSKLDDGTLKETGKYNAIYIQLKWGANYEFVRPFNDPQMHNIPIQQGLLDVYGKIDEYPSKTEYARFVSTHDSV
jgi:hypothetical protein